MTGRAPGRPGGRPNKLPPAPRGRPRPKPGAGGLPHAVAALLTVCHSERAALDAGNAGVPPAWRGRDVRAPGADETSALPERIIRFLNPQVPNLMRRLPWGRPPGRFAL